MPAEWYETGVALYDGGLHWDLHHTAHSWSSKTPKWRTGHWEPLDTLLGRPQYSEKTLREFDTELAFPEKVYRGSVKLTVATWKRPRWFARRLRRAEIKVDGGVPVPGKGENSWDCAEDVIYSLTTPAVTEEDAIAAFVRAVLSTRRKYATLQWRPKEHAEQA